MPIYEYQCKDCGSEFELLIRGEEQPVCPGCGRKHLTKSLSVPAAHGATLNKDMPCGQPPCGSHQCSGGHCAMGH